MLDHHLERVSCVGDVVADEDLRSLNVHKGEGWGEDDGELKPFTLSCVVLDIHYVCVFYAEGVRQGAANGKAAASNGQYEVGTIAIAVNLASEFERRVAKHRPSENFKFAHSLNLHNSNSSRIAGNEIP